MQRHRQGITFGRRTCIPAQLRLCRRSGRVLNARIGRYLRAPWTSGGEQ